MTEPGDPLSLEMVTAALRMDSADVAVYTRVLTKSLSEALPPGYVTVERERSMSDRMRGRSGEISKVAVRLGDQLMTLAVKNGQPAAEICREVRGVVLSRENVPLQQWASALAHCCIGTDCRDSTTPRTSRQISATGRPFFTASVMTWSPSRTSTRETSPGRPRIRSDMDRSRSTVTYSGGSASLSDLVRTLA